MKETRKYFDYELAYKMYKEVKETLDKEGIKGVELDFQEVGDRENGYTSFYGADYNTWVYLTNSNFDTDKEEKWYVSGEVDMISYGEGDENIFIDNIDALEERKNSLLEYARKNDYTLEDIYAEYDSIVNTIAKI